MGIGFGIVHEVALEIVIMIDFGSLENTATTSTPPGIARTGRMQAAATAALDPRPVVVVVLAVVVVDVDY